MPTIRVKETEPFEVAVRRFKRLCEKTGIIADIRKREFYEKPTTKRKREKAQAIKRWLKRNSHSSLMGGKRVESRQKKSAFQRNRGEETRGRFLRSPE